MAVYLVTGKLGAGKTLAMVGRMRDYLASGKPVASNVDIDLRKLCRKPPAAPIVRLPDRPGAYDLACLGIVHSTGREEMNGMLLLDECGTFLNSREWSDKGRQGVIEWLLHSRKLGWDVFLIIQAATLLDKQIRDALVEYSVVCRRMDRLKIPVIGPMVSTLTSGLVKGTMPKVHVATVRYGMGAASMHADTWFYRGAELYGAYSTTQVISESSPGMHSLVWYATDAERAKWKPAPKPKLPAIARLRDLPRTAAWVQAARIVAAMPSSA